MKTKIISFVFLACFAFTSAGYEDGLIGPGEYEGSIDWENGLLVVNGGGADRIRVLQSARLDVWSTSPFVPGYGGIWDIVLRKNSHMNYYGGETEELTIYDNATANIYGGRIDAITSFQNVFWMYGEPTGQHINLYCQPGWSWTYENNVIRGITGVWWDDTPFNIRFTLNGQNFGFDPVWTNINVIVPEPTTVVLLSIGAVITALKNRRAAK